MHLQGQALCRPLLPSLAWVTHLPPLPAASCCCPRSPVMHAPPCPLLPLAPAADCLCLVRPALHFHLKATVPESSEFGLFLRFFFGTTGSSCVASSSVALAVKNPPANAGDVRDAGSLSRSAGFPGGGHGNPLQYSCLENPHGQNSLMGYSPWGHKESDKSEVTEHVQRR